MGSNILDIRVRNSWLTEPPEYGRKAWEWVSDRPCKSDGIEIQGYSRAGNGILLNLLDIPTFASKRWVYR